MSKEELKICKCENPEYEIRHVEKNLYAAHCKICGGVCNMADVLTHIIQKLYDIDKKIDELMRK